VQAWETADQCRRDLQATIEKQNVRERVELSCLPDTVDPRGPKGEVSGATTTDALDLHDALACSASQSQTIAQVCGSRSCHGVGRHDQMGSLVPSHGLDESAEIASLLFSQLGQQFVGGPPRVPLTFAPAQPVFDS
jgi:hypothetical protein